MEETLQLRIYGDESLPTLIYLPGLHGDWTLVGGFRKHVLGKVRFVEMMYPRTLAWSLDDYAAAIETALAKHGITHGWLLGESFGSQPLWALAGRKKFPVDGIILAGGFVKHAMRWAVRLAERVAGRLSLRAITWLIFTYGKFALYRHRNSPEIRATLEEFAKSRTEMSQLDLQAAQHRLHLIAENNPCDIATNIRVPVFAITGRIDPVVPWPWVQRWLKTHCAALRDYKVISRADHNILATAPQRSADQILAWIHSVSG